ncbi:MAG: hypothetical protein AB7S75_15395 [Desulfococcaceae bacterium]
MKKIFTIYDIFEVPNRGIVIGGINPEFDRMSYDEIKKIVGKTIEIHKPDGVIIKSCVADFDISISIVGKKNLFILLEGDIKKTASKKNLWFTAG